MIAAAARTSGTISPLASTLYRGRTVSAISRAIATARARASVAFRLSDRSAEYSVRLRAVVCGAAATRAGRAVAGRLALLLVAASAGPTLILKRLRSARGPI